MKIPMYSHGVNYFFRTNNWFISVHKIEGLNMKRISKNAVISVIFLKIKWFSPVKYTEKQILMAMSMFLDSEKLNLSNLAFEF